MILRMCEVGEIGDWKIRSIMVKWSQELPGATR